MWQIIVSALTGSFSIFTFIFNFWKKLDERTKKLIIENVIEAFSKLLRAYYQEWKKGQHK
jgi:hypothetical protein